MRLVTYRSVIDAAARLGVLESDLVIDVERLGAKAGQPLPATMLELIDLGPVALAALREALDEQRGRWPVGAALPLSNVKLLAPIPRPRKNIFGIGLNYRDHAQEAGLDIPSELLVFTKFASCLTGPVSRGDVGTVDAHLSALEAISPEIRRTYVALARATAVRALDSGRLRPAQAEPLLDTLADQETS